MPNEVNTVLPDWEKLHRLVPSHFPPIDLFENVASPDELEIVFAIESITNDRLREEVGDLALVPEEERVSGPGSTPVMAAFTHISIPTRFTDGTEYGVYYGARDLNTAFAETIFHREKFLAATNEPDTELTMRCYINKVALELHDVRGDEFESLYTDDYVAPQEFAKEIRAQGSNGLLYRSVRDEGGECVAAFKPKAVTIPVQGGHYKYIWSGKKQRIENILEISLIK
ncbi:MAG: RES family NAD+ phosphorylase [Gammaproteobacteria bacterium]|nr:RES family NAD+ phosphorylase [Gammaproteobacteria bacterium]MCP4061450.1 RES family NAD+ phosphorylase [Pseudoalteromonas sp.]|tara:strand:- start:3604 stop:4287 length:684 start_codon:yes stop_codon:yes gene_type:complete